MWRRKGLENLRVVCYVKFLYTPKSLTKKLEIILATMELRPPAGLGSIYL